jgi:hypothetical protein
VSPRFVLGWVGAGFLGFGCCRASGLVEAERMILLSVRVARSADLDSEEGSSARRLAQFKSNFLT